MAQPTRARPPGINCMLPTAPAQQASGRPNLVAGLIPRAMGVSDPDLARALQERDQGMERRPGNSANRP